MEVEAYRQGDVALFRVSRLPKTAKPRAERIGIIRGENGHNHTFKNMQLYEAGNGLAYALVLPGTMGRLEHEEHETLTIPSGVWEIRQARQYVPRSRPRIGGD